MRQNSEPVWRWSGEDPYILRQGDAIFVSISKPLSAQFVGDALNIGENLGLESNVYGGLQRMPSSLTSNIHISALCEFKRSRALIVVLSLASDPTKSEDWILEKIDDAIRRGVVGTIYFVRQSGQQNREEDERNMSSFRTLFPTRLIADINQFAKVFRQDLLHMMGRSCE